MILVFDVFPAVVVAAVFGSTKSAVSLIFKTSHKYGQCQAQQLAEVKEWRGNMPETGMCTKD